jgi:hypothetical protein
MRNKLSSTKIKGIADTTSKCITYELVKYLWYAVMDLLHSEQIVSKNLKERIAWRVKFN